MAKKHNLDELFEAAAHQFEAAFSRAGAGIRPDEIGEQRERQVRSFLREWLPPVYGVSNGYVIDANGNSSQQCDVVLYDALRCPKFLLDASSDRRMVPFGSAYGSIEVKSTLSEATFRDALQKIGGLHNMNAEPSGYYSPPEATEELDVLALESEHEAVTRYGAPKRAYVPDENWDRYRVKIVRHKRKRTDPIGVVFAYRLAKSFSFEQAHAIAKELHQVPDAIIVLREGFSFPLNGESMMRYKSISHGKPGSAFGLDNDVVNALLTGGAGDRSFGRFRQVDYFTERTSDKGFVLLYFYTRILDLLGAQTLTDWTPTDLVAMWRNRR